LFKILQDHLSFYCRYLTCYIISYGKYMRKYSCLAHIMNVMPCLLRTTYRECAVRGNGVMAPFWKLVFNRYVSNLCVTASFSLEESSTSLFRSQACKISRRGRQKPHAWASSSLHQSRWYGFDSLREMFRDLSKMVQSRMHSHKMN